MALHTGLSLRLHLAASPAPPHHTPTRVVTTACASVAVATASTSGQVILWGAPEDTTDLRPRVLLLGHTAPVVWLSCCIFERSDAIVSVCGRGFANVWDPMDGRCLSSASDAILGGGGRGDFYLTRHQRASWPRPWSSRRRWRRWMPRRDAILFTTDAPVRQVCASAARGGHVVTQGSVSPSAGHGEGVRRRGDVQARTPVAAPALVRPTTTRRRRRRRESRRRRVETKRETRRRRRWRRRDQGWRRQRRQRRCPL